MTVRFIVADVFDGLASLETGSVDLVVTSPPFLALRSYLPADHPDKHKEIGSEATPAEFIDVMLGVTQELRRVLAPHGSICVELGDTYAGSGGAGGDYAPDGFRDGQPLFRQDAKGRGQRNDSGARRPGTDWQGWPLAKSRTLIPQLYEIALAYGINPLTGQPSFAGRWRVRNIVTWARPNPPVGALGDKWRPATSDVVVACLSNRRYWDDLSTRRPVQHPDAIATRPDTHPANKSGSLGRYDASLSSGAPLLDYWVIPPGGYQGSHYAVFPPELVVPLVKAMCPEKVCRTCGEPSRRIVEQTDEYKAFRESRQPGRTDWQEARSAVRSGGKTFDHRDDAGARGEKYLTAGWTDCGHDTWRPGLVLDPFAGSGTTLAVATGHGHDTIGIDLDQRNAELARERIGPFFFEEATV